MFVTYKKRILQPSVDDIDCVSCDCDRISRLPTRWGARIVAVVDEAEYDAFELECIADRADREEHHDIRNPGGGVGTTAPLLQKQLQSDEEQRRVYT